PLLIADEPTAHLDYVQVEEVLRVLRQLASDERVVVVATHDHRLLPLADQVVELVPSVPMSGRPPEKISMRAGEVIFKQGAWGELIYVVEHGEVEIVGERVDGGEDSFAVITAGEYFGEIAPLFGMPRSATARARTDVTLVGYSTRDFRERVTTADRLLDGAAPTAARRAPRRRLAAPS
ncbi:MAG: putative transport system ATP-binding protein, partial [Actinomycetota bacterium]|nr:putative transport system ATP-binding protein [Actinomycetota bacterium]